MKLISDSVRSRTIRNSLRLFVKSRRRSKTFFHASVSVLASLCLIIAPILGSGVINSAGATPAQAQVISVGVLTFRYESGAGAPQELGQKIAQSLQQMINVNNKNLLARPLSLATEEPSVKAMTVEQLAAFGKQSGVKFVVRGAVLAISGGGSGGGKVTIQLYADVVSVETSSVNTVRAEGSSAASKVHVQPSSTDFTGDSPLGQAVAVSVEQLAASVSQTVSSTTSLAATTEQREDPLVVNQQGDQSGAAQKEDAAAVEADEELRQIMAQAEALLSSSPAGSVESLNALGQALNGLKTALASKAALLEQGKETTQADQEIVIRKQDLQSALATITQQITSTDTAAADAQQTTSTDAAAADTQQIASADTAAAEDPQASGEKKNALAHITEYMGEALNILQKIQEMRALFRSATEEASLNNTAPADIVNDQPSPTIEPTAEISGEVMDSGAPAEGIIVTEPESGSTAITDGNGLYTLKNVLASKMVTLQFAKAGKQLASGRVDLANRRSAIADFNLNAKSARFSAVTIIPSVVVVNAAKPRGVNTGTLRGVVRDAGGAPLARALVNLKGIAMARTDSQGKYVFMNVPSGTHQVTVQRSGLESKAAQIQVAAKRSNEAKFRLAPNGQNTREAGGSQIFMRGAGASLHGVILDNLKRSVAGAKITLIQSESAVSVISGLNGGYEFRNIKPGMYRTIVSKLGYEGASQFVVVRVGGSESRDFQLNRTPSPLVEKAIAQARRTSPSSTVQTLTTQSRLNGMKSATVDSQKGSPIPGATISTQGQQIATTNREVRHAATTLPTGNNKISVNTPGLVEQERSTAIRAGAVPREESASKAEKNRITPITPSASQVTNQFKSGQLRGQVTDAKTGRPLSQVAISVSNQRSVVTDQAGLYTIANMGPGVYQVSLRKDGYSDTAGTFTIRAGETATANFKLIPRSESTIRFGVIGKPVESRPTVPVVRKKG
jgi:Carboxypeptidase regulatory-like domain